MQLQFDPRDFNRRLTRLEVLVSALAGMNAESVEKMPPEMLAIIKRLLSEIVQEHTIKFKKQESRIVKPS